MTPKINVLIIAALLMTGMTCSIVAGDDQKEDLLPGLETQVQPAPPLTLLDTPFRDAQNKEKTLKSFKGKLYLIVVLPNQRNVPPQLIQLDKLYVTYKDRGLVVLGFPCKDFGNQEAASTQQLVDQIKNWVSFPVMELVSVHGQDAHPLFKALIRPSLNPQFSGPITWMFTKFLITADGKVLARFEGWHSPMGLKVRSAVEHSL